MTPTTGGSDAVARYWDSVSVAAQSANQQAAARAAELLRLQQRSELFRPLLPSLPPLTIDTISGGGRNLGKVDPIGGWGQGMAIRMRESRVDPFPACSWDDTPTGLNSLIWGHGHQLRANAAGERQRQLEADLMLLQLMVKARLHQLDDESHADARVDLNSYGGCGKIRAQLCNQTWPKALKILGLQIPAVLVRHGRTEYTDTGADPWAIARPSCQGWPVLMLRQTHEPLPDPARDAPTIRVGGDDVAVPPELWAQWVVEQRQLDAAVRKALPELMEAIEWPSGDALLVDEMPDATELPAMPAIAAPVPTSYKVQLPVDAAGALQTVEAQLRAHDAKHGTTCWESFAQLISGREQLELVPPRIDPGQVDLAEAIAAQIPGCDLKRAQAVVDRIKHFLLAPIKPEPEPAAAPLKETIERLGQLNTKIAALRTEPAPVVPSRNDPGQVDLICQDGADRDRWLELLNRIQDLVPWIECWSADRYGQCKSRKRSAGAGTGQRSIDLEIDAKGHPAVVTLGLQRDCTWLFQAARREGDAWVQSHGQMPEQQALLEQLLERLDPGATIVPAPAADAAQPGSLRERVAANEAAQSQLRKQPEPAAAAEPGMSKLELQREIERLCREHGNNWPARVGPELVRRSGLTRQAIHLRKRRELKRLQEAA